MTPETLFQDAAARDWTDDALAQALDQASGGVLARESGAAAPRLATLWAATAHVALPVPIAARLRRLRAAALRAQGGRDRIHKAIEILERGRELHRGDAGEV